MNQVQTTQGQLLSGPTANRYPFRLAQYFDYQLNGTILVNRNKTQIDPSDTYLVSLYPAMGINYLYVGGDISATGVTSFPGDCVTNIGQAAGPLLVFASAGGDGPPETRVDGYCMLTPPSTTGPMWSTSPWSPTSVPSDYGHVDARYHGKAVCAFLDGSVKTLTITELQDMRLWSNTAAAEGSSGYSIPLATIPKRQR